jgi:hypothetical protein
MITQTPKQIVRELNKFIVGQKNAKRAVAIAMRNRWRRQQVPNAMKDEIVPNNIILIGSTGVGKTEIARRLANLANAPFLKVEASKFTEVGYVGRDVESIIRDLMNTSVIIDSTSLPTYPTSVNLLASTFRKGAFARFAKRRAISVFPTPVEPMRMILLGTISSFIAFGTCCLLHLFLIAMATARLAFFCPTMNLFSSRTICFGVWVIIPSQLQL